MSLALFLGLGVKLSLFLIVFGVGLSARPGYALCLFRDPGQLVRMIVAMHVVMLALTLSIAHFFDLHPAVKIALVVLAVAPVPPVLPNKALKAGGESEYIVGVLVAACLFSIIFIPLSIAALAWLLGRPLEMPTGAVAMQVSTTVFLPLAAGMAIRRVAPQWSLRFAKPSSTAGTLLLLACAAPFVYTAWHAIVSLIGNGTVLAFAAFVVVGLAAGHLLGGPHPGTRRVLALASASRHPGIAIAIAHADFPDQKLVVPAIVLYLIVCGIVSMPYLKWVEKREKHLVTSTGVSHG